MVQVNEYKSESENNVREEKPCSEADFMELSEGQGKGREGKSNMQNMASILCQMGGGEREKFLQTYET